MSASRAGLPASVRRPGYAIRWWGSAVAACLLIVSPASADEFRGFWVDAWGAGFHSQSEVQTLLGQVGSASNRGRIRDANCNAVVVQVRRRADTCYPSGVGEPYMSGLSPSNFNALQAMIDAAHDTTGGKKRIEVHCWIVTFATGSGGNPPGGSIYYQHNNPGDPDNYWMTLDDVGNETDDKAFDPGHPRCLEYITDVCMDLVTNFDIDGLHYDYIRFTGGDQGYNPTSIARYNARYGLTGQPSPGSEQFKQWRRDQVTALVRRVYANAQAVRPEVKVSGAFVTWNPSPTSATRAAFMNTRPYYDVYSDWDAWTQEGIIDMSVPMTYYNQASLPNDFARWMEFQKSRKFNRHNVVGPGVYLNSLSNAILQLQMTRNPASGGGLADGFCGYSYRVPYSGGSWTGFGPSLVSQVTPTWEDVPDMPWKSSPTRGHIMGTATYAADGAWADGAQVSITGPESRSMRCDGTGFYAFIDLTPGTYTLTASQPGFPEILRNGPHVVAGSMTVEDVAFGAVTTPPVISGVQVTGLTHDAATINWTTDVPATSQVNYGTTPGYGSQTPLNATETVAHSVPLTGLSPSTTYYFEAFSGNGFGSDSSGGHTFNTPAFSGEIVIDNLDPGWANTSPSGGWSSGSIADVPKVGTDYLFTAGVASTSEGSATRKCTWTGQVPVAGRYDVFAFYQIGSNRTTSAPYKVSYAGGDVTSVHNQFSTTPNQGGWFLLADDIVIEAGASGTVQLSNNTGDTSLVSADAAKFVYVGPAETVAPDFDEDGDVDADDFGHFQACATGPGVPQTDPACEDADLDGDGDVDMNDFGIFQRCISGANQPADPNCAD